MDRLCGNNCWLRKQPQAFRTNTITSIPPIGETNKPEAPVTTLYQPLQSWETRLVELHPGTDNQALHCKLLTADIVPFEGLGIRERSKVIQYDALSYS
jgi:hypothetical protein